ncbi:hypothetical protein KIPB_006101, partial [Kipferlia bialata]|eukprot:g6101.t1
MSSGHVPRAPREGGSGEGPVADHARIHFRRLVRSLASKKGFRYVEDEEYQDLSLLKEGETGRRGISGLERLMLSPEPECVDMEPEGLSTIKSVRSMHRSESRQRHREERDRAIEAAGTLPSRELIDCVVAASASDPDHPSSNVLESMLPRHGDHDDMYHGHSGPDREEGPSRPASPHSSDVSFSHSFSHSFSASPQMDKPLSETMGSMSGGRHGHPGVVTKAQARAQWMAERERERAESYWMSEGSPSSRAVSYICFQLASPWSFPTHVVLSLKRCSEIVGEPLMPPRFVRIMVSPLPSPTSYGQSTPLFRVFATDRDQVIPLSQHLSVNPTVKASGLSTSTPCGGYMTIMFVGARQRNPVDKKFSVAVRRVSVLGHALDPVAVPLVNRLNRGRLLSSVSKAGVMYAPQGNIERLGSLDSAGAGTSRNRAAPFLSVTPKGTGIVDVEEEGALLGPNAQRGPSSGLLLDKSSLNRDGDLCRHTNVGMLSNLHM